MSKKTNKPIKKWAKHVNIRLTKEDTRMSKKHMKKMLHTHVIREIQLKQQGTAAHVSEWHKARTLPTPNAGEDVAVQGLARTAGGRI